MTKILQWRIWVDCQQINRYKEFEYIYNKPVTTNLKSLKHSKRTNFIDYIRSIFAQIKESQEIFTALNSVCH